jgi:hypothetical protein
MDVDIVAVPENHFEQTASASHTQGSARISKHPNQEFHLGLQNISVLQEPTVVFCCKLIKGLIRHVVVFRKV